MSDIKLFKLLREAAEHAEYVMTLLDQTGDLAPENDQLDKAYSEAKSLWNRLDIERKKISEK